MMSIHPRYDKLITGLRTAVSVEHSLNETDTSFNDLVDAYRMATYYAKRKKYMIITLESKDRRIGKQKIVLQLVTKNMRIRQVYRCITCNTILGRYMTIRYGVHVVLFRTCQMSNKFKVYTL